MPTLHVLSDSPFTDASLSSCLRLLGDADGLLLCGDAVYALQADTEQLQALELIPDTIQLYALEEDVEARSIDTPARAKVIGYPEFVRLSMQFAKVNSWL
ncbi:sulfurtransferase complex subunit TusB [Pseudomonas sp. NPDC078700]|uniref:sulfurtransferase complex subunit TusB n=1 Tax=Pseudomonas sp. NPDC078700 TaxID=3364424 RepID=UPI0037C79EC7